MGIKSVREGEETTKSGEERQRGWSVCLSVRRAASLQRPIEEWQAIRRGRVICD